jgi:hypothetical protein
MAMETGINAGTFQEYDYTCEDFECEWKQITEYWRECNHTNEDVRYGSHRRNRRLCWWKQITEYWRMK